MIRDAIARLVTSQHIDSLLTVLQKYSLKLSLPLTWPYYVALKTNTLDIIEGTLRETDSARQDALLRHLMLAKLNESRYVQVAVSDDQPGTPIA